MTNVEELKKHYLFSADDEKNLRDIGQHILPYASEFAEDFYEYLVQQSETSQFFQGTEATRKRKNTMQQWLKSLLEGPHDLRYIRHLEHIGREHVRMGIRIHWVTASMNYKRQYLIEILERKVDDQERLNALTASLHKILDINLDVLSSSYHDEEIKQKFLSARLDSALVSFAERFTYGLNIILVLALVGLSLGVVATFFLELVSLVQDDINFGKTVLSAVGTLLIIWVMIELMRAEINYLKGEPFHMEIFISVALVASIRELLIATLAEKPVPTLGVILASILVLGIVYFLISKTSARPKSS